MLIKFTGLLAIDISKEKYNDLDISMIEAIEQRTDGNVEFFTMHILEDKK